MADSGGSTGRGSAAASVGGVRALADGPCVAFGSDTRSFVNLPDLPSPERLWRGGPTQGRSAFAHDFPARFSHEAFAGIHCFSLAYRMPSSLNCVPCLSNGDDELYDKGMTNVAGSKQFRKATLPSHLLRLFFSRAGGATQGANSGRKAAGGCRSFLLKEFPRCHDTKWITEESWCLSSS